MKRTFVLGAVCLAALLAIPATARADHRRPRWSFGFGFGCDGPYFSAGYSGGYQPVYRPSCPPVVRHVHSRTPYYRQVWVAPVYERVVVGYDHCGRPIFRTVQVSCGHYETVLAGYRCECGHNF